ncbi:MAG TPA: acetolactate synthase small subunit [Caldithrix abyssi]|uniref:Acetolactate synthase small subunit n=1 Tax=Caldithrix abyssi TaxID=187145 RepID=A0A7V4TXI2_CALAY|nr:acetolactate synthase small subunit [Caldithrix abyssi]
MRHTISLLVENTFGAFDRIATMFSAKGFNIHSISIGETEIQDISRMTIVTSGDDQIIEQVVKQLNRLIDTVKVVDLTEQDRTERELALISVNYQKGSLEEIKNISDIFRGKVVDINNKSITLEITGPPAKINAVVNVLMPYGIKEMARSGTVALRRGEQVRHPKKEMV